MKHHYIRAVGGVALCKLINFNLKSENWFKLFTKIYSKKWSFILLLILLEFSTLNMLKNYNINGSKFKNSINLKSEKLIVK